MSAPAPARGALSHLVAVCHGRFFVGMGGAPGSSSLAHTWLNSQVPPQVCPAAPASMAPAVEPIEAVPQELAIRVAGVFRSQRL